MAALSTQPWLFQDAKVGARLPLQTVRKALGGRRESLGGDMVHGHVISDVNSPALPTSQRPWCESRREIANGHIIADVNDIISPRPYPPKRGPSRPRLFHEDWLRLDLKRAFRRHCLRGSEGYPLLDGSRFR
jgi:hypothetical protein